MSDAKQATTSPLRSVAVVHGQDEQARSAMFAFLRALNLEPQEWGDVLTKVGSVTPYTGQVVDQLFKDVQAVVVLFTPDEEARLHPGLAQGVTPEEAAFGCQPRPNVLFEAGMAFGLHPDRTILVEAGRLRAPSDLFGRNVVRLQSKTALNDLATRLEAAGCPVNKKGSDWLDPTRFSTLPSLTRRSTARVTANPSYPNIFPTNIWLNGWEADTKATVVKIAKQEQQKHPIIYRKLERDLRRNPKLWSLYTRKDGPNAQLRIRGQVNLQADGPGSLSLLRVQQRFFVNARPVPAPPDAGPPFGFDLQPKQEFNVDFEIAIPDREYGVGELLYGLHISYQDEEKHTHDLETFWWYDFVEDKFWNNMNLVPYFDSVRKQLW